MDIKYGGISHTGLQQSLRTVKGSKYLPLFVWNTMYLIVGLDVNEVSYTLKYTFPCGTRYKFFCWHVATEGIGPVPTGWKNALGEDDISARDKEATTTTRPQQQQKQLACSSSGVLSLLMRKTSFDNEYSISLAIDGSASISLFNSVDSCQAGWGAHSVIHRSPAVMV